MRRAQIASIALCALSCSTLKLPLDLQARVDAAPIGTEVLVPAGSWTGELTIRRPVTLRGAGREATTLSGVHPIVVLSPGVTLESLTLRGSESGLRVAGHAEVTLRHLQVTSPGFAIAVEESSTLKSDDLKVECARGGLGGVYVKHARWTAHDLAVSGSCRRGIEVVDADVDLTRVTINGAREAGLHALTSTLKVSDLTIDGLDKGAPGLFSARSNSDLHDLRITGGEEAILMRGGDTTLKGLTVSGSGASAFAAIAGEHRLSHVSATGPFQQAAIAALGGASITATDVTVLSAGTCGIIAVRSKIDVDRMTVDHARSDGDGDFGHGVMVDRSTARVRHVRVTHAEGSGLYVAGTDSVADVEGLEADKVASGVMVALGGRARVQDLHVSNAPMGLVATGLSHIHVKDSSMEALVGILVCKGSTVEEECGLTIKADLRLRPCDDDNLGAAWNQVLNAP